MPQTRHTTAAPIRFIARRFIVPSALLAAGLLFVPAHSQAKPAIAGNQKITTGTYGFTNFSGTKLHVRPSALTPYVAKVSQRTRMFVWGKFDGWYRVETTDHVFGWVYNKHLNVTNAKNISPLSHAKTQQACRRSDNRLMYGTPDTLRQYYAKYKSPGAARGLKMQNSALEIAPKVISPQTISAKISPTKPDVVKSNTVRTGAPQVLRFDNQNSTPPMALPAGTISTGDLPPISADDILRARRNYLESQRRSNDASGAVTPTSLQSLDSPRIETLVSLKKSPDFARSVLRDAPKDGALEPEGDIDEATLQAALEAEMKSEPQIKTIISFKKAPPKSTANRGGSPRDRARYNEKMGQGMANQALSYRGMPYISGASSPKRGFDCSGLVYFLLRQRGYHPPRTAAALARYGTVVPKSQLQAGDMVFFANTYKRGVSHIGVYVGNNKFVHAANSRSGVKVSSLSESYYQKKWHSARRPPAK